MRRSVSGFLCAAALGLHADAAVAQQQAAPPTAEAAPAVKFGGLAFGDLYHVFGHHDPDAVSATGFVLRRGYFTVDVSSGPRWFGRARAELNQSGAYETYTFTVRPKDLYVGARLGRHRVLVGLSPTPTFDVLEGGWGLRYLMRTPLDLQGVASRDTGIAVAGPLNASGRLSYRFMLGAGARFGNESGDGRKVMAAITWRPARFIVEAYADYERLPGPADRTTLQGFVLYLADGIRAGAQYAYQDRQDEPALEVGSVFVVKPLSDRVSLVARMDRLYQPSPAGDNISYLPFSPDAPARLYLGAAEFGFGARTRITPNVVVIDYDRNAAGQRPPTDVQARLTLFVNLE